MGTSLTSNYFMAVRLAMWFVACITTLVVKRMIDREVFFFWPSLVTIVGYSLFVTLNQTP